MDVAQQGESREHERHVWRFRQRRYPESQVLDATSGADKAELFRACTAQTGICRCRSAGCRMHCRAYPTESFEESMFMHG